MPLPYLATAPLDALSMTLLAQQLPPLPNFAGEHMDGDEETFEEWLERLELVAATCHWDNQTKLVNIATRLRGSAFRFYRTCPPQQRSNYASLMTALKQRFTPIRIQAVQSSRFHERKQGPRETVDSYAQDLRRLFQQAYSSSTSTEGADRMVQSVLAYQFAVGLVSELKCKLVGREGSFVQLLEVTRFKEARIREVGHCGDASRRTSAPSNGRSSIPSGSNSQTNPKPYKSTLTCYNCGGTGHYARENRTNSVESKPVKVGVSMLQAQTGNSDTKEEHRQEASPSGHVVNEALARVMAQMYKISPENADKDTILGPTPTSEIFLDGTTTTALVDTGSPVSIVSMDFFLKAAAANRGQNQTPDAWGEAVRKRLNPSTMSLHSYGGTKLPIIGEAVCCLSVGHRMIHTQLQIQEKAPVELLLGTDTLYKLGFSLRHMDQGDLLADTPEPHQNLRALAKPNAQIARQQDSKSVSTSTGATVKFIQAARVPAGHAKLIRAELQDGKITGDHVFEPALKSLHTRGLSMADAMVTVG